MLTPVSGYEHLSSGSNQKVLFSCSCGRSNVEKIWKYYVKGDTKTCGECFKKPLSYWETAKYGSLRLKHLKALSLGSNKKEAWVCDCGKECYSRVFDVTRGYTKSCGKCNEISPELLLITKYGNLKIKKPEPLSIGSHKLVEWICDCGNDTIASFCNVLSGNTKSCGKCNNTYLSDTKYWSLSTNVKNLGTVSSKKIPWRCDCGREKSIVIYDVITGKTKTCGNCNSLDSDFWQTKKFGRLSIKDPSSFHPLSHKRIRWVCDCGHEVSGKINDVYTGKKSSCGDCINSIRTWFAEHKGTISSLCTPIFPDDIPLGGFKSLERIDSVSEPFRALCYICGSEYTPRWFNIKRGISLTCGCSTHRISSGQHSIFEFLRSKGFHAESEYEVGKLKYDIFVSSKNLLIEYNGLRWHSNEISRSQDFRKYKNAIDNGYDIMVIFEDEWAQSRAKLERLFLNKLSSQSVKGIRPSKCVITRVDHSVADDFYGKNHYIGPCRSNINYGVYLGEKLIGCTSFKRPTRQSSKHEWELVRMASDAEYRVHGIWSKICSLFIKEYGASSIVSFSDNRLFSGSVYGKMGFTLDGEIPPDYYWVKGSRRFHKSALRKTPQERLTGLTESQLRKSQGYRKIYDCGKKRWVKKA